MEAENWPRIEELFHATVALDAADRSSYLQQQCSGDALLLHDVESLIAAAERVPPFLKKPDLTVGYLVLSQSSVSIRPGQTIGQFHIISQLGKGGMGEVYLADDKGLERQVALKFFDADLADNEWAREQLMAEARAVAKLEHANICSVHEFKRVDEYSFIVMQYVEGETLEEVLRRDSLDVNHAIKLAEQLVSGLAAAHGRGIIHRDIKPRNLMVTPEEQIKVLDFGLAKHVRQAPVEQSEAVLNTTELGIAAGTAAYMSPEQSNGESLDFRSDIFSFGIVFYEMLTGENPFLRGTRDATIDAIRNSEPPPPARKGKPVRRELREIVATCLAKDREQRFASTRDLLVALNTERAQIEHLEPAAIRARMLRRRKRIRLISAVAVPLLILLLIGANYARLKLTRTHSLAILKIDNKSDRDMRYLSDGLTRNLLAKFSYFGRIKTKAPTESGARADEPPDVLSLGRELNVEAILYGELSKVNDAQLLHLRLMDTATGKVEWEQTYNLATLDLFTLQNDIAARVMSHLGLWLTPSERNLIERRQTTSQEALEAYMRGRYHLDLKRGRDDMVSALKYFDEAIAIDPAFARAFAARADCYIFMANVAWGPINSEEAINKARFDAKTALDIDPTFAEGHNSMGKVFMWGDWNWQKAEAEFLKAIEINPEYPQAHYDYSRLLAIQGRYDESIQQSQIATAMDPHSTTSRVNYGRALYYARRLNEAEDTLRQLLTDNPESASFLHATALVLASRGKSQEAVTMLEKAHKIDALRSTAALGYVYGRAGRREDALKMLRDLDELAQKNPVPDYEKALPYLGMGDKDNALRFLEEAYKIRYLNLISIGIDPMFDELRTDPRFISLVQRIGLPH